LPPNSRHGRYERIIDAFEQLLPSVMTLTTQSTLERFSLRPNEVYSYTTELYDSDHEIFEIQTARGSLRLTGEHPVLKSDGRIVFAKDLRTGDELIRVDGSFDPVKQISTVVHHGKVYNLRPSSSNLLENIIVAQDFLVGSSQYQNDYVVYINRVILGHTVPASVLPTRVDGRQ
jgi:hypothetical protein